MKAVIKIGSSQYIVQKGQEIEVDRLQTAPKGELKISDVLLVYDQDKTLVGQPFVSKATVSASVINHFKGDKVRVGKFKAKSRYRKVRGFRSSLTKLTITDVSVK